MPAKINDGLTAGQRFYRKHRERMREKCRSYHAQNPDKNWARQLRYAFGITVEDYNKMFTQQKGCCAICTVHQDALDKRLCVDHDHSTGVVRGLLCFHCNTGLGHFRDDPVFLERAADYMRTANADI